MQQVKKYSSISKEESVYDTSKIISGYVDIVVLRDSDENFIFKFAEASEVPVINTGNGTSEHPTQALLDVYTIVKELYSGKIEKVQDLSICIVGDLKHGRTVHSLCKALSLFEKVHFKFVSPNSLKALNKITDVLRRKSHTVQETENLNGAI